MKRSRVLAPVDFSDDSTVSATLACALTDPGGELVVVHVDETPEHDLLAAEPVYVPPHAWQALERHRAADIERHLDALRARLQETNRRRATIRGVTRAGHVVDTICSFAEDWRADLMVLGAHGESGSVRFLFGSVAAKVARQTPCPTLVTRPGHAQEIATRGHFRRALVGIDYSAFSRPAVRLAAELVDPGGALHLLHVRQPPSALFEPYAAAGHGAEVARIEAFSSELGVRDHEVKCSVELGNAAALLLSQAHELEADVIVVGTHGRSGILQHIIGTVADRVLRHAEIPVLLVPRTAGGTPPLVRSC